MGSGGVAIAALPTVICLKVLFSDGLWGDTSDGDSWERLRPIIYMGGIVAGFFCIGVPQLRPTA